MSTMAQKPDEKGLKKRSRRALFSSLQKQQNESEAKFDGKRLDLRLPGTLKILNDDTLKKEENSLREPIFAEKPRRKSKASRESKDEDAAYDVTALKTIAQTAAAETTAASARRRAETRAEAEKNWHDMPERVLTPEEERDARVIENRAFLDPKRFYRATGTGRKRGELPSRVQFGTVVVGPHEFFSSRLTRKERKPRIIDQVLADQRVVDYTKRRSAALQNAKAFKRVVDPPLRKRRARR